MRIVEDVAVRYPKLKENVDYFNSRQGESTVFWEDLVSPTLCIVEAVPDKVVWEFKVEEKHCNQLGNLHGGCVATVIDICTSFAICCSSGKQWNLIGISTDLSVSYLRGASEGDVLRLECGLQRAGSQLANMHAKVYDQHNRLCYSGSHTKFNIDARL